MNKMSASLAAACLLLTGLAFAADESSTMPQTRGMQGMDPAMHMEDCKSSDTSADPSTGPHKHKDPSHN